MPWVRIDDGFAQHPKVVQAGPLAMALQVAGLCYANRNMTDGFIPWAVARSLVSWQFILPDGLIMSVAVTSGMVGDDVTSDYVIDLLLDNGIWEEVSGGYYIHDYTDYQPTKAEVLSEREKKASAGRAGGLARAQAGAKHLLEQKPSTSQASAQAKSKPVPVPVPVPNNTPPLPSGESPPAGGTPATVGADAMEPDGPGETVSASASKPRTAKPSKTPAAPRDISAACRDRLLERHRATLGEDGVLEAIADALSHKAARNWTDIDRYVANWVRREAERIAERHPSLVRNGHGTPPVTIADFPAPEPPPDDRQTHDAWANEREVWWQANRPRPPSRARGP